MLVLATSKLYVPSTETWTSVTIGEELELVWDGANDVLATWETFWAEYDSAVASNKMRIIETVMLRNHGLMSKMESSRGPRGDTCTSATCILLRPNVG